MTSRLLICFSLLTTAAAWAADVSGRVRLTGSQVSSKTRAVDSAGVVVWLEPASAAPPSPPATLSIAHKNKTFVPHIVAARQGDKLRFPNLDPFFHNAFSNYDGQVFDIGLHPPGSTREVILRRPGIVRLFCNIHPTMSAVVVVLETPYYAVTTSDGAFHIPDVPPGDYRFRVFHERAVAGVLDALERTVSVGGAPVVIPLLSISEAGYLVAPHQNKFGKSYPAVIVDQYPNGAKRP